ncbi:MAG: fibronectin type III domain-containing protein [Acidobacteriota bacterium]|nr:fibronectin type III domain-containing protein [Acidobacteriota bacterium]
MDNHFGGTDYTVAGNDACRGAATPPAAPSGLTAASPNNSGAKKSRVMLVWEDNADDEQVYHVERSTDAAGGFVEVGTAAADATSYQDEAVESKTTYYYRVRASNAGGYSGYSNTAGVTVK